MYIGISQNGLKQRFTPSALKGLIKKNHFLQVGYVRGLTQSGAADETPVSISGKSSTAVKNRLAKEAEYMQVSGNIEKIIFTHHIRCFHATLTHLR